MWLRDPRHQPLIPSPGPRLRGIAVFAQGPQHRPIAPRAVHRRFRQLHLERTMSVQQNIYRQRHNFSKIRSLVPIPNLIDIQKRSYDEFLQMNLLHEERENRGLKAVFDSMFPVHNGKSPDGSDASLEVEFVDYTVGHWACKCGKNEGLGHLRTTCKSCGHHIVAEHPKDPAVDCPKCGDRNKNAATVCD